MEALSSKRKFKTKSFSSRALKCRNARYRPQTRKLCCVTWSEPYAVKVQAEFCSTSGGEGGAVVKGMRKLKWAGKKLCFVHQRWRSSGAEWRLFSSWNQSSSHFRAPKHKGNWNWHLRGGVASTSVCVCVLNPRSGSLFIICTQRWQRLPVPEHHNLRAWAQQSLGCMWLCV